MVATKQGGAPLWRGYFFAGSSSNGGRSVAFGVLCLVRVGDCPSKMPDAEIDAIKSMIVGGFVQLPEALTKPVPLLAKGEHVKFTGGPFEGVRAIYSGMRAGDRERFLLSLLRSSARRVLIPSHQVAPV